MTTQTPTDPGCFQTHGNIGVRNTRPATCVHASVVWRESAPASLRVASTYPARRATKTGVRNEMVAGSDSWSSRTANTFAVVEQKSKTERNSCSRGRLERKIAGRDRDREAMSTNTDAPT